METNAIVKFMQEHYSDEKLAELLAHAEDGKLQYTSCCCFIGIATSDHALRFGEARSFMVDSGSDDHYEKARGLHGAEDAELQFWELSYISDAERRAKLIPLIRAEMERREALKYASSLCPHGVHVNRECPECKVESDDEPSYTVDSYDRFCE